MTDIDVQRFWRRYDRNKQADQDRDIASTLRRVRQLLQPLSRNIVGQSTSTIDIRQVMDEGKILLVKLDTAVETITELIGSLFIALLLNAAQSRADLPVNKRRQFNLYADEFQRFSTEDFATLLEEARKYAVATTIAHQNRGQLDSKNSQLETNLKDRTRSAANLVVFRINSKDAGDLAGEFDITPQEAWEEEIEPIRFERVEEQVADEVEEDILEIPHNPFEYLSKGRFIPTNKHTWQIVHDINNWPSNFWVTYTGNISQSDLDELLIAVMQKKVIVGSDTFNKQLCQCIDLDLYNTNSKTASRFGEANIPALERLFRENIPRVISQPEKREQIFQEFYDAAYALPLASVALKSRVSQETGLFYGTTYGIPETEKEIKSHFEDRVWYLMQYKTFFLRLPDLVILCEALAKEPIRVPSGQKQLKTKMRTHVTYHTIPAKTILHPQRTYADVLNEVASLLTNLPVYTARIKITSDNGIEEHTIRTLDPKKELEKPLFGQALQERIARIQAQNRTPDERGISYCRPRQEVEAEILNRQSQCCEPPTKEPPDAPPISRHPPH